MKVLSGFKGRQGAGAGSAYIVGSFALSGALTFAFQGISIHALGGPAGYAPVALLWSATFLVVQVLWIGATQTLGRYVAERETQGRGWRPVVRSVRNWQAGVLAVFLVLCALAWPLLVGKVFKDAWLTVAFVVAVALYAPEYFRRGLFNGYRQSSRLGAQIVAEASGRVLLASVLLAFGAGVAGPALAIVLAPLIGVLAVRPGRVEVPEGEGEPFSAGSAVAFAGPVLVCMACAQGFASGGPILVSVLDGSQAQIGLFGAAIILTRVPQYVLSPAIGALLPHASRILAAEGQRSLDRFILKAVGVILLTGAAMVGGTWLIGEWAMKIFAGASFEAGKGLLVALAALAAAYLLSDVLNQALFAREMARRCAVAWVVGIPICAVCLAFLDGDLLIRLSLALVAGTAAVVLVQTAFYLTARRVERA